MKKLILSAAIVLGSLTAINAQTQTETTATTTEQTTQEQYTEIKSEDVPTAVTEALKKDYPDALVSKAYVNDKKEYKLEITVKDQSATVFADVDGNWLKK
ncbi:hypothetical protein [Flavobacterium seoulense]|uniref:Beta-lactamase-inhibitor-like PepSY-like domain-containing protein n=1 Tax=Flavobacterium seoulense TaxID=1492738 RepID=A0A066WM69_9FLAO|nr:hypothetical protein [Flavobacterium seoulense]KDN55127.1 hypothetical protein FEM21_17180 [Flavobacterium seoulense]